MIEYTLHIICGKHRFRINKEYKDNHNYNETEIMIQMLEKSKYLIQDLPVSATILDSEYIEEEEI